MFSCSMHMCSRTTLVNEHVINLARKHIGMLQCILILMGICISCTLIMHMNVWNCRCFIWETEIKTLIRNYRSPVKSGWTLLNRVSQLLRACCHICFMELSAIFYIGLCPKPLWCRLFSDTGADGNSKYMNRQNLIKLNYMIIRNGSSQVIFFNH